VTNGQKLKDNIVVLTVSLKNYYQKKSFIVGLRLLHMKYLIKGKIVDSEGKPIN